jgi:NAD(P)-dependent dehydrogenase (short-subunit alcohol dehydrogenase family)
MARIFITGSADGLGKLAANALIHQGHQVVLHARNHQRAQEVLKDIRGAETVVTADLSSLAETKDLALELNKMGRFDAVIHNAGLYQVSNLDLSVDGLPLLLAVNTLAPYVLTSLMDKPNRLIYLSSGMHLQGDPTLTGLTRIRPRVSYSDSKLHDLLLAKAVARKWPASHANAVDPGWVPTKMGGAGAPDNLEKGYQTQVWLAASHDPKALVTGRYFHHQRSANYLSKADDITTQEQFLARCEQLSGVRFPAPSQ